MAENWQLNWLDGMLFRQLTSSKPNKYDEYRFKLSCYNKRRTVDSKQKKSNDNEEKNTSKNIHELITLADGGIVSYKNDICKDAIVNKSL